MTSSVEAIRIQNLRSLKDTGFVALKPITLLVGRNSAGKSTFARTLPLLRQSIEEEKRAPILWYGRLVDFGSYKDAISRGSEPEEIVFGFKAALGKGMRFINNERPEHYYGSEMMLKGNANVELYLTIQQEQGSQTTYASKIRLEMFGNSCVIVFSNGHTFSNISINDYVWSPSSDQRHIVRQRKLIPRIDHIRRRRIREAGVEKEVWLRDDPIFSELKSLVRRYVHGNTSEQTLTIMCNSIALGDDEEMLLSLKLLPGAPPSWKDAVKGMAVGTAAFIEIKNLVIAYRLSQVLEYLDSVLANYFSGVKYLEPLRATAQRYYRKQELAIDDIDSKGANVAMYLDSLTNREKMAFELWTQKHFGIAVETTNEGGHVSLKIRDKSKAPATNLADMGFGFSQVLPIAVQLWSSTRNTKGQLRRLLRTHTSSLVIEQPELHLHPEYQARIADVIVATVTEAREQQKNISVIAETHSPHIVNRLGQLIALGLLGSDDVQVVLFDREDGQSVTTVRSVKFGQDGVLEDWPYGFFEPEGY